MNRPRNALEAAIDAACGLTEADYEDRGPRMPDLTPAGRLSCCCGHPGASRRACGAARGLKNPCRCACHGQRPA